MAGKLTKRDYERVLGAEYGFPVFLTDKEFARLQVERPAPEMKHAGYKDPFGHVEHKPAAATQPGVTYNSTHGRNTYNYLHGRKKATPTVEDLGGDDRPNTAEEKAKDAAKAKAPAANAPGSSSIGKIQQYEPPGLSAAEKADLAKPASFVVGAETLNMNDVPEDLGGDDRPNTPENKIADQEMAALNAVPAQLAALPQTYKQGYTPAAPALPQWQSDEDEWEAMNRRYAMLLGGK